MTTCRYLYRKRDRFHFRRRLPGLSTYTAPVSIPLGTTDAGLAHIWIGHLSQEFDRMFDSFIMLAPPLPDTLVARYFERCLEQSLSDLRRQIRMARMMGRFGAGDELRQALLPMIYESFIEDGFRANLPIHRVDPDWPQETLDAALHLYAVEARKMRSSETDTQLERALGEISEVRVTGAEHMAQLREAHVRARLEALRQGSVPNLEVMPVSEAETKSAPAMAELPATAMMQAPAIVSPPAAPPVIATRKPAPQPASVDTGTMATLEAHFDAARDTALAASQAEWSTEIAHVFWRAAKSNDMSDQVMKQRCSDVRRFMFITGLGSVDEITQSHLTHWSDTLKDFPKTFLRSEKDAHRSLKEVLTGASGLPAGDLGLSPDTMRRHVKSIELLLDRARAEGVTLPPLDPAKVKPKKSSRKKHKARPVFRVEEVRAVFRHPIWTGCKSIKRRHDPGKAIYKDGKFWIPLVIAYTGARRAEIAGMLAEDVQVIDGIPVIVIQSNRYRGIKGEPDGAPEDERRTRIVPIHSHLIELGFLDFVAKARKGHPLLFPDVVPTPRKGSRRAKAADPALLVEKFGESFDDAWRKAFKLALDDNPRKLCIHSLRHYVNHTLLHMPGVHDVTRIDMLGHVQDDDEESINTSTYRDETPLDIKRAAIEMLPRLM